MRRLGAAGSRVRFRVVWLWMGTMAMGMGMVGSMRASRSLLKGKWSFEAGQMNENPHFQSQPNSPSKWDTFGEYTGVGNAGRPSAGDGGSGGSGVRVRESIRNMHSNLGSGIDTGPGMGRERTADKFDIEYLRNYKNQRKRLERQGKSSIESTPKGVPKGIRTGPMGWLSVPFAKWPGSSGRSGKEKGLGGGVGLLGLGWILGKVGIRDRIHSEHLQENLVVAYTDKGLESEVSNSMLKRQQRNENSMTFVEYSSPFCHSCLSLLPSLMGMTKKNREVDFILADINDMKSSLRGINKIPTFDIRINGRLVDRFLTESAQIMSFGSCHLDDSTWIMTD
ncbi:hypothetical protein AAMO2058_001000700 [Amorphochlora amoebiformis]